MKEEDLNYRMEKAISHLEKEFQSIRTSRANINMLDNIFAEAYDGKMPLNQLGNISVPESSMLTIKVLYISFGKVFIIKYLKISNT